MDLRFNHSCVIIKLRARRRCPSVCWLGALCSQDFRPPYVLPIPGNVLAPHPHHDPAPQQRLNLCLIRVLDHRDHALEDDHASPSSGFCPFPVVGASAR
jgi:hypothetical protein